VSGERTVASLLIRAGITAAGVAVAQLRAVAAAAAVATDEAARVRAAAQRSRERRLTARLDALRVAQDDFTATVSHELRTPLTSISGYTELLLESEPGTLSAAQVRMLEVIGRNAARLRELIEDMLTAAAIEAGDFRVAAEPFDLAEVLGPAIAAAEPAAGKASVRLHADVRGPLPLTGDAAQLDRVVTDLLSNAIKFTAPDGTVGVHADRRGDDVRLIVADTGMGIPAGEQHALFTRFFRASNAVARAVPGTGLGLSIVRTVVDRHGGSVQITSTEDVGTTVTVRLPARTS
jgi:signal transduction histidine kinase